MNGPRGRGSRLSLVTFTVLPVILAAAAVMVPAFFVGSDDAAALSSSEWATVREFIDSYISAQFQSADEGEAGYLLTAPQLKTRIDSNNDGVYLGEGDDAYGSPVLVDVLNTQTVIIPATAERCSWNSTCFGPDVVGAIRDDVNAHETAGFSSDVVVYCLTGHTESPVTGGYGAIAQTGGLGGNTTPKVLSLKWGRSGWYAANRSYPNSYPLVSPGENIPASTYPTNPNCTGVTPDSELVRCTAEWAVSSVGGNVGNGTNPPFSGMQVIDIRSGNVTGTANGGYQPSLHIPIETLFNSGLQFVNPANPPKKLFVGRTQHVAGIAAIGAEMLGYDSTFLQWGLANYNNLYGEKFTGGAGYPLVWPSIDSLAPIQSNVTASNMTQSTVDISRATDEPATMKVEYGTSPGVYDNVINDTVLNADKTLTLTGLQDGNTYYYRVTSYDGMANASASVEGATFIPVFDPCYRPDITLATDSIGYWASYADYLAREMSVDLQITNNGSQEAYDVDITGASNNAGITLSSPAPVLVGNIPAGVTADVTLKYHLPAGIGAGFTLVTRLQGSATAWCGNGYTYP